MVIKYRPVKAESLEHSQSTESVPGLGEIAGRLGELKEERLWRAVYSADLVEGRSETVPREERSRRGLSGSSRCRSNSVQWIFTEPIINP